MATTVKKCACGRVCQTAVLAGWFLSGIATDVPGGVPQLEAVMDHDPELPEQPVVRSVPPRSKQLWIEALSGPEEDLWRETATAILRAHQQGFPELEDSAPHLLRVFAVCQHAGARLTIAAALIELDARQAAGPLFERAQGGGTDEAQIIEPALARWDHPPARDVWLRRLTDPAITRQRLLLAIDGLRTVKDLRAAPLLRNLAIDRSFAAGIRLPAARALSELQSDGLFDDAARLSADRSPRALVDRLVAVSLLSSHRGDEAEQLLRQLALDEQAAVAVIALRRLLEIDPELIHPLVETLLTNTDAGVRRLAAQSLADRPSVPVFETLGGLLNDPHPDVRRSVRQSLLELAARPEFDGVIRTKAMHVLAADDWRGQEQSAHLLGELDHKPAASRLVKLLYSDRAEVYVTAAWSLRKLAVRDVLPDMFAFTRDVAEQYVDVQESSPPPNLSAGYDACLSHLFQAFGLMRYAEPEPILLAFIPRRYDLGPRSRGAAAWAVGFLHENDPQRELMLLLGYRVADAGEIPFPEPIELRANAAISLGRMNAVPALEALRHVYGQNPPGHRVREACSWAIERITGEDLTDPEPKNLVPLTEFLQPLGR
ncbi:MAG: HEAT repeat domain-containing protein [Planctomycetaceae bacterium]